MLIELDRAEIVIEKPSVLVVDNDALVRLGTIVMLRDLGYDPVSAANASDAMSSIAEIGTPDILVTDYAMPGDNGVVLANRLSEQNRALRVLIVSGHDQFDEPLQPEWQVLQKPFTSEELNSAMETIGSFR